MSDDRFKQARRSLIDRHNQRQQQGDGNQPDTFDGDFEDEATAMVNLDGTPHQFNPPPNYEEEDARTEMLSVDQAFGREPEPTGPGAPAGQGVQMRTHSGVQPSYDGLGNQNQPFAQHQEQPPGAGFGQPPAGEQHGGFGQPQYSEPQYGEPQYSEPQWDAPSQQELQGQSPQNSLVIGDSGGFDGNTQFVNLNDFAEGEDAESFVPDDSAAGYEGSTQFVNLNVLQAGAAQGGQMPVEHDPVLKENYQFGPESVQHGEFTLIFAQNTSGRPVILKRIWEGDPNGMPMPVRQRVAALDQIRHPRLIALNGMLTSQSGAWVELNRPPGYRLTDIIENNGPQPPDTVKGWIAQAADILGAIHKQGFVYANLTTDALWVQEDGTVLLEPFDVLSFEHRGSLGAFGPPEMNFPPEQRQLYPSSDIYSLATVTVAAITGLPVNLGAINELPKKIANAVTASLQQNPQERPATMEEFVGQMEKSGGMPAMNMKIVIAAVALLAFGGLGGAWYFLKGPGAAVSAPAVTGDDPAIAAAGDTTGAAMAATDTTAGGTNAGTNGVAEPPPPEVTVAGVAQDPRVTIETSYAINPPEEPSDVRRDGDPAKADAARAEARELLEDVDKLVRSQQEEKYQLALQRITEAVRLSGGPTPEDEKFIKELFEREDVQRFQRAYFEKIHEGLESDNVSRVKAQYPQLSAVDANATDADFFSRNKAVSVSKIKRSGAPETSDDEDSEE